MIVGSERATIILPMGMHITIEEALLYPDATRSLLSYKDICCNRIYVETHEENKEEFLLFTNDNGSGKETLDNVLSLPSGLYIKPIPHVAYKVIFHNVDAFQVWHDRLGHPRVGMMGKIICSSIGHDLSNAKSPQSSDITCTSCATGKLILRPSYLKIKKEPLKFFERIQGDICGPNKLFGSICSHSEWIGRSFN